MRRSLCYTEPKFARAGKVSTWKFLYQPSSPLAQGAMLKFDIASTGRDIDWQIPSVGARKKSNVIWLTYEDGTTVHPTQLEKDGKPLAQFEFLLPKDTVEGEKLSICIGSPDPEKAEENGNQAQKHVQRRRSFYLSIDAKGKGEYKDTELFSLDVRGGPLASINVVAPSLLSKNRRFDIVIRFEDAFGNLTGNAPEETMIDLSYEQQRDNINWKLFVPETGFITLPNLYFNETGIYRIQLTNLLTKETFFSPPIRCVATTSSEIFWGTFHGEFELYDCAENAENALRHVRDDKSQQFFSTSPFESEEETSSEIWKYIATQVAEFNEEERFTTFLGFQWAGEEKKEGLRTLVYAKDGKSILRKSESKSNTLKKIYRGHTPKDFFSIPSFTMAKGVHYSFDEWSPEYEKVAEIYNAWGSSECSSQEGNPRPIVSKSKKGYNETIDGSLREALKKNCRFGFVAGGYDDRGIFAELYDTDQQQYSPGLTAILSEGHSRDAMIQALNKRSCFATTGKRMIIGIEIAMQPMGSELSTKEKPGLAYNRHISGFAVGTDALTCIEIIRNGTVFETIPCDGVSKEFTFDDTTPIQEIVLPPHHGPLPFVYYYLRATQKDGHMAWSSPIWIDVAEEPKPIAKKGKKKTKT